MPSCPTVITRGQTALLQYPGHVAIAWLGILHALSPDTLTASHLNVVAPLVPDKSPITRSSEDRQVELIAALSKEFQFIPIAIETLGPVGEEATRFLQELDRRIEAVTSDSRSMSFLWQRLNVAVQKGNAAVLGTEHWEAENTLGCF